MDAPQSSPLVDYLPPIYRHLLPSVFHQPVLKETRATCDDCAMCSAQPTTSGTIKIDSFDPSVKCCTYHPSLPNYLVGALLSSTEQSLAEGKKRLTAIIEKGQGISPRGVLMPARFALLYEKGSHFFGRSKTLVCPYLDGGQCSIWKYREAVCTSYFCKYVKGPVGKAFWGELQRYLTSLEIKLALYSIQSVETEPGRLAQWWEESSTNRSLLLEDIDDLPAPESKLESLWGPWRNKIVDFYIRCGEAVAAIDPNHFEEIAGIEEVFLRHRLELALGKNMSEEIPSRLRRNPELCVVKQDGNYVCTTDINRGDVVELNALFYPLLDFFDGTMDRKEVCQQINREKQIEIPDSLIARLYHIGILVEPARA